MDNPTGCPHAHQHDCNTKEHQHDYPNKNASNKPGAVQLDFPDAADPMLWGLQTTLTAERLPLQPPASRKSHHGRVIYSWTTERPPLHSRFRFEWRFRNVLGDVPARLPPGERMRRLGIVQRTDPLLLRPCAPFELPAEADLASATGDLLVTFLEPLAALHNFGKGMGLAAPQIDVPRAAAVVKLPDGRPQVLYNPSIIASSPRSDERLEGCLSFFDVRGPVPRSLEITVEHSDLSGARRVTTFTNAAARHWQHEIDHIRGILYTDRMDDPAKDLLPLADYQEAGEDWEYKSSPQS